jgi:hypothetical protein
MYINPFKKAGRHAADDEDIDRSIRRAGAHARRAHAFESQCGGREPARRRDALNVKSDPRVVRCEHTFDMARNGSKREDP